MSALTIVPVEYGPDYTSRAAAEAGLRAGKEFRVQDMSSDQDGRCCTLAELKAHGITQVRLRFKRLTQVHLVTL